MKKLTGILLAGLLVLSLSVPALGAGETADLVTDAYTYTSSAEGYAGEYHIPQVNLPGPGTAAVNAAIWRDLYDRYMYDVQYAADSGAWSYIIGVDYSWAVNGDVLSLLAVVRYDANDLCDYFVYNVSLTDGERLSDRELFQAAGVTREKFNELLRTALYDSYNAYADAPYAEFVQEQQTRSTAEDNLAQAMPYMGRGGALCAVARQYAIAGAESYLHTFTLSPGDLDSQLVYFIEHSDSQYFTENDIEGFTKDMCLYARNGVYARSGRGFQSQELLDYFLQFDWYSPDIAPDQFSDGYLNDYQTQNIALVMAYEQAHGY